MAKWQSGTDIKVERKGKKIDKWNGASVLIKSALQSLLIYHFFFFTSEWLRSEVWRLLLCFFQKIKWEKMVSTWNHRKIPFIITIDMDFFRETFFLVSLLSFFFFLYWKRFLMLFHIITAENRKCQYCCNIFFLMMMKWQNLVFDIDTTKFIIKEIWYKKIINPLQCVTIL